MSTSDRRVTTVAALAALALSSCAALVAVAASSAYAADAPKPRFPGIGRPATPAEVKAWDIDVRPDLTGLPKGSGSVQKGEEIWEAKCASCHGIFGESNEVFPPIAGGTKKEDIERGVVAGLVSGTESQRTTLMKLSQISTLWDYINRAMPWNAPKTLTPDEVYAVTAYILSLGSIVPEDFVLSDRNMAEVQAKLPNRNGLKRYDDLWRTNGKGDVANTACMRDCVPTVEITSSLPEHARSAHGNIADQNRLVGPVRGQVTAVASARPPDAAAAPDALDGRALAGKNACLACHAVENRVIGPSFREVAAKYQGVADAPMTLFIHVKDGTVGGWGKVPMPPHPHVPDPEVRALVQWILAGAK